MADYGKLLGDGVVQFERMLPGPIERVWDHFAKPELRQKWFCGGKTDQKAGGTLTMEFDHSRLSQSPPPEKYAGEAVSRFDCEILVFEPPHRLEFTWPSEQDNPPTQVSVTLREEGDKVRLILRHWRLERGDFLIGAMAGWHAHLDLLEDNLERRRARDFWPHHMALEAEYEAQLQSSDR